LVLIYNKYTLVKNTNKRDLELRKIAANEELTIPKDITEQELLKLYTYHVCHLWYLSESNY